MGPIGAVNGPEGGRRRQTDRPPPAEQEGTVGKPYSAQKGKGDGYPQELTGVKLDHTRPGSLIGHKLKKHAGYGQKKGGKGDAPAVLGAVEPVQRPAHLLRVPHLVHCPGQGGLPLQTLCPVVGGLIGDMVGELPQQGLPGPPPADLGPYSGQVVPQNFTRHRTRPLPVHLEHPRHRSATPPPAGSERPVPLK